MFGWPARLLFFSVSDQLCSFPDPSWRWARLVRNEIEVGKIHVPAFLFEAPLYLGLSRSQMPTCPQCLIKVLHLPEFLHLDWGLSEEVSDILIDMCEGKQSGQLLLTYFGGPCIIHAHSCSQRAGPGLCQRGRTNQFLLALLAAQLLLYD